jgi:riboflavin transporter FmnP
VALCRRVPCYGRGFLFLDANIDAKESEKMSMCATKKRVSNVRFITVTAVLGAAATVLMMLSFSVPFMPAFIKLDFSELPALIATFSMGPWSGVLVCLIKNLINLPMTTTGGVGELSNFLLGVCLVLPSGLVYRFRHTRGAALFASVLGSVMMGLVSLPINYFVTYPIYSKFMPIETIVGMYQAIWPSVDGLLMCLLLFNVPFTCFKGLLDTLITFLIYKPLSPLLRGKR